MSIDLRFNYRIPFTGDVLVNGATLFKASNISEGGIYVITGRPFTVGSIVTVAFSLYGKRIQSKAIVRSCDGSIGIGLNFIGLEDADRNYIRGYIDENYDRAGTEQKRVFIVEDSDVTRNIYKTRLGLDGYAVVEARDGLEAVGNMHEVRPDIVVLDLYMEKMDGYKVLAYIRGNEVLKNIPVIIFSSRGTQSEIDRARLAGASAFLVKMKTPPAKLSETVKKLLKIHPETKKSA